MARAAPHWQARPVVCAPDRRNTRTLAELRAARPGQRVRRIGPGANARSRALRSPRSSLGCETRIDANVLGRRRVATRTPHTPTTSEGLRARLRRWGYEREARANARMRAPASEASLQLCDGLGRPVTVFVDPQHRSAAAPRALAVCPPPSSARSTTLRAFGTGRCAVASTLRPTPPGPDMHRPRAYAHRTAVDHTAHRVARSAARDRTSPAPRAFSRARDRPSRRCAHSPGVPPPRVARYAPAPLPTEGRASSPYPMTRARARAR